MSNDFPEEEMSTNWDYKCPQFCDFNATETWAPNEENDHFFDIDHERDRRQSNYNNNSIKIEVFRTLINDNQNNNLNIELKKQSLIDCNNYNENNIEIESGLDSKVNKVDKESSVKSSEYLTPPQNLNKENIKDKDNEDNEVFYSTKKSFTVEKKYSYQFRLTPMRTLQHNGTTPLRETRISTNKKKKYKNLSKQVSPNQELFFDMNELVEALPSHSELISQPLINDNQNETTIEGQQNDKINETHQENGVNENFKSNECIDLTVESSDKMVTTGRTSYVIQTKVHKNVKLVSPIKSAKISGSTKRVVNSFRIKGTPIRKPTVERRVRSQSIGSSLYSAVKNTASKYKSMAELINEFETKPRGYDRSRSLERSTCGQRSRSSSVSSLTRPISPKLHAIHRHRCDSNQLTQEEMIAQEIKKYAFKANPIRKKLFDAKFASGIPRVKSTKAPTKAIGMSFLTEKRTELRSTKSTANNAEEESKEKTRFRANPMPAFKNPVNIFHTKSEKKATTFKPFSFDDRDRALLMKKQQSLHKNNQKAFNFNDRKAFKF